MGYWDSADQPFYYSLARTFPIADRYFCSVLGQTYPNRRYLIAARPSGRLTTPMPTLTDYPANGTIFDTLTAAGVTWKDYYSDQLAVPDHRPVPAAVSEERQHERAAYRAVLHRRGGWHAARFCLVEPNYDTQSEENPQNIAVGEAVRRAGHQRGDVRARLAETLLIWTYDEHGGYYDHVPPPPALAPDDIPPDVPAGQSRLQRFRAVRLPGAVRRRLAIGPAATTCRTGCSTTPASAR